jgi:hypothetical protein
MAQRISKLVDLQYSANLIGLRVVRAASLDDFGHNKNSYCLLLNDIPLKRFRTIQDADIFINGKDHELRKLLESLLKDTYKTLGLMVPNRL